MKIKSYKMFVESNSNNQLVSILMGSNPVEALLQLDKAGILSEILPELTNLKSNGERNHKDNFIHTLGVIQNGKDLGFDEPLMLSCLLHDIGKFSTKRFITGTGWTFRHHEEVGSKMLRPIWNRLNLPEQYYKTVEIITRKHGHVAVLASEEVTDSAIRRFLLEVGEDWKLILIFSKADMTTRFEEKKVKFRRMIDNLILRIEKFLVSEEEAKWRMVVTGNDIMEILGIPAGRKLGQIKKELEDKVKSGEYPNDRVFLLNKINEYK